MRNLTSPLRKRSPSGVVSRGLFLCAAGFLVTASQMVSAQSSGYSPAYEPSSRQRLRAEKCMKDEFDHGALCVKRCDEDFKLDLNGNKPLCRAIKASATRKPPRVEYQPPQPAPNQPPPKGGY